MPVQLAYLGLGHMGQAMCMNLVKKGKLEKQLIIYNRTPHRAISLKERIEDCIIADSVEDAVSQSDIIFSCLTNDAAVNATFDAALSQDLKGKLFVDCSTTTPETTAALAKTLAAAGAGFVAMPVFGEPSMAEAGNLVCVPAGLPEHVDRVKPYCTGVIGKGVIDMGGEEQSKATVLKLIGNIFIVDMIESVAAGHVMAEKTGLGHGALQNFLQQIFPGPFALYSKKMVNGDYYQKAEPAVAIGMARGLISEVLSLAAECGTSLRAYEVAAQHMAMVEAHAGPTGDISGIYGAIRQESGLKFENQES